MVTRKKYNLIQEMMYLAGGVIFISPPDFETDRPETLKYVVFLALPNVEWLAVL